MQGEKKRDVIFDLMLLTARHVDLASNDWDVVCGKWPKCKFLLRNNFSFNPEDDDDSEDDNDDANKEEGKIVAIEIIIERKEIHTDFAKKFLSIFYPEAEVKIAILLFYTDHIFFVR